MNNGSPEALYITAVNNSSYFLYKCRIIVVIDVHPFFFRIFADSGMHEQFGRAAEFIGSNLIFLPVRLVVIEKNNGKMICLFFKLEA